MGVGGYLLAHLGNFFNLFAKVGLDYIPADLSDILVHALLDGLDRPVIESADGLHHSNCLFFSGHNSSLVKFFLP